MRKKNMLKYENIATVVISVDLHNDYSIISMARWDKENQRYYVSLYIKQNDTDILDLIEKQENMEFNSDIKSIRKDMAQHITTLFANGFFKYYIDRYEYAQKCHDFGEDHYEQERILSK